MSVTRHTRRAMARHRHDGGPNETALACMVCGESFGREEDLVRHGSRDHVGVDLIDEERAVP
jgi:hypothetical protein